MNILKKKLPASVFVVIVAVVFMLAVGADLVIVEARATAKPKKQDCITCHSDAKMLQKMADKRGD